ncbi:MAG: secondary thiamine-phosphate synthase enzyme YjbQ [Ignavibacteriaceae bacterium]
MFWHQVEIEFPPKKRGFHLITYDLLNRVPEIKKIGVGTAHIFLKHTSASLTINENADPDVRADMEKHFDKMVPENAQYYEHALEGSDDMPAHIKASLLSTSLTVPIKNGSFNTGTWQGIYLCEHRKAAPARTVVVTLFGEVR